MSSAIASNDYSIGYIDSGHGHDNSLSEIELENRAGTLLDSLKAKELGGIKAAAAEALSLGIIPSDPAADFSAVSLHNMPGEYTWPIVAISYIFIRQDQRNETHGALLKAFVDYVISEEGQELLQDYNFEGVPKTVLAVAGNASAAIELAPDHRVWQFEDVDTTQRGAGQEDYVMSGKRRSYYEFAISQLQSALSDAEARLDFLEAMTPESATSCGGCSDDDNSSDKRARNIAIALSVISLVIAILACLVAASALQKAGRALNSTGVRANEMTNIDCVPCGKPKKEEAYGDLGKQEEHDEI